ncbi:MAG: hypothetical protein IJT12_05235 [Paludibacteraceae bacterium]|nr:hypothetical protein [Paludibacteraceae bacterium]
MKKNLTPLTAEESQAMNERQKSDTLPDFLQPFAGDSTIHINYAYGIPFIIDDSVPMLLPPIDKEPKGYVSSQTYNEPNRGGGANRYGDRISACGIKNPIDSLLWLNKCINDLPEYIDNQFFPITHRISFFVQLYKVKDSADIILFSVAFFPDWECHSEEITLMQISVLYAFDCEGNLLSKSNYYEPIKFNHGRRSGELNKKNPNTERMLSLLNQKSRRYRLFLWDFYKKPSESVYPCFSIFY